MLDNEESKNNYFKVVKKRSKLKRFHSSHINSEFRSILRNENENDNTNIVKNNNYINEKNDKKPSLQYNVNNINIYKMNEQKIEPEKKEKKVSILSNNKNRRSSLVGVKQNEFDNIEEDNEDELNFRQRITLFFDSQSRLFYIQLANSILSIVTCIYYIICTYIIILFKSLNFIDFVVCALFLFEHIINILLSHHFLAYILSIESLLNFFIEIPPFFSLLCTDFYLDGYYRFINVTRIFRLIKGFRILEMLQGGEKSVNYQIFYIIGILVILVFIWAGVIHILDLAIVENDLKITFEIFARRNLLLRTKFHHYIYFTIVSLTTVGYGEIVPLSNLGRFMIILLVIVILVVIPEQTSELINLSNAQTIYERRKYLSSPDIAFAILLGDIELETLKNFIKEYFDRNQGVPFKHIVILMNKEPDKIMELFLNKEENVKFITYLQGDPMNDNDLLRCDILHAKSCIIFTNKNCIDPHSSDHQSLLLSIFIKKLYYHLSLENYYGNNTTEINESKESMKKAINILKNKRFRIFMQLNKPENSNHYFCTLQSTYKKNMLNDKLLVIESFKMNLLSKSIMAPGIITLIGNLVISNPFKLDYFKNEKEWLREYAEGQQYKIFKICIEGKLLNYTFQKLAMEIYNKFHSVLIALEINFKNSSVIKLNPISNETINDVINSVFYFSNREKTDLDNIDIDDASLSFLDEDKNNEFLESQFFSNFYKEKKEEIDRKKIRIFVYLICDGKETKNEILKLDRKRILTNKRTKTREITTNNILETLPLNIFNGKKRTKKTLTTKSYKSEYFENPISYYSSESGSEEEIIDKSKFLVNPGSEAGMLFDMDELSKNYYITNENEKSDYYSNEIMKIGIKDRNDIKHHVIICGMHIEIIHLILPLRAKYIPEKIIKWIVILSKYLPHDIHETLSKFTKIIFIQGDPLKPEFLHKANISSADIAVILNSSFYDIKFNENNNEIIGKEEEEFNGNHSNLEHNKKPNDINRDAKILFIYKSIKKLNSNIQIITDLSKINSIEFLHSSKELKKLFSYSKIAKSILENNESEFSSINKQNNKNDENLNYEYTPIYAAGEVFFPSLIDRITGQMFHKEYLYHILNLLLIGEKELPKSSDKKITQLYNNLINSNLFLIPCESRNESFGDMFQRLLVKNKMICIALYRKNINENFYYVYSNPRKTTLIRDTDLVFVLSSTNSILNLIEKNLLNFESLKENYKRSSLEDIEHKISINEGKNLLKELNEQIDKINSKKQLNNNSKEKRRRISIFNENPNFKNALLNKGKYIEIDNLQKLLDKGMEKLKEINKKINETSTNINNYIKEEIKDEFCVYLNKKNIYK